ncbi:MAG: site-2 protease family protein [Microcystaceae cyanobacterium]
MSSLVLLIILGLITYALVKQSVAFLTQTPLWLLWLVMMTPAFIWAGWVLIYGEDKPIPLPLMIIPFVICPIIYVWLVQMGRPLPESSKSQEEEEAVQEAKDNSSKPEKPVRPITPTEEKSLRDCFPWGIYYLQNLDYRPQAIVCRGRLRTAPEKAYHTIKENVEQVFGDRFLVLFQEGVQGQPFFALIPNPKGETDPLKQPLLSLGLLLITLFTTTWMGAIFSGISRDTLQSDLSLILEGLPYGLAIIAILGVHELGHYFAGIKHKIKVSYPYFIPFPQFLGVLGAFVKMRSPMPNRQVLFDIAIAGPLSGFIVTLPILLWGLSLSQIVPIDPENTTLINFQALDPRFSFLLTVCSKIMLGTDFTVGQAIDLHPLAIAGYVGMIVTALNLMPVGALDGGQIVHGMLGQKTAIIIAQISRFLMLLLAIVRGDFIFWLWTIFLWFIPLLLQPVLNDVTELNSQRDFLGFVALLILLLILLPVPATVIQWLNL